MSTRGCVAVGVPLKWEGVYNHYDSYPVGLGKQVWDHISNKSNLAPLCEAILRSRRWEAFLGDREIDNGQCMFTSENADPLFIEWVYIIDPERKMLHVLKHESVGISDFSKRPTGPIKLHGRVVDYGHCAYKHVLVASLKLDGPEPDWSKLGREGESEED
jgi:hypothetical protein